ncbi:hypothetical protein FOQG_11368 [Fusarium oxysporum f. sp. raphani 54005]|uniref:Uncharacterized protein n=7 Tax=Fusarium oxysporum TaxID=5507 RepID=A0A420NVU0_FUSOX|nr:uncharacterized protein FOBCDRAFT_282549 [Fusarium oxysporum Fo47]ENH71420.1 hypothetical protein FOC1_g10007652 [Fusarium oxysporum f. sp. cubense race 1]EWZ83255.1 hypothetical protein FOWG_13174 [Fusarium oxysporum f. sp. lycopersici MN25]EXK84580.1 hypothetical protein FOQG_11368 [Fusarium oxysporum f. sp. raphani 54005]EXL42539.1 hypothetical protein FOCG_15000 [Fusarium oxysporum f. sp. radicis-lycopersici 26381]EXM18828.1 hypothetical protein FOTG_13185 [Fusarium oxysporum f. sp. vas
MSAAIQTKSIEIHFKLKAGKKHPKQVLLQELQEHYGMENVAYNDSRKNHLTITIKKSCDTYEQMKEELWPKLKATDVFKTWEAERIMVLHADNHCSYPLGNPYPGQ